MLKSSKSNSLKNEVFQIQTLQKFKSALLIVYAFKNNNNNNS